jgi:RNA polymerase sigma factor (sigma-70 family)
MSMRRSVVIRSPGAPASRPVPGAAPKPRRIVASPEGATATVPVSSVPEPVLSRLAATLQSLPPGMRGEFRSRVARLREEGNLTQEVLASLLMEAFSRTQDLECFSLLYELCHRQILLVILKRLRFAHPGIDPKDVLQDVFLSIYRYPHRFRNEKECSFRNWSFSIVRNTLLKHLRNTPRTEIDLDPLEEVVEDERAQAPDEMLVEDEESARAAQMYAICLLAYRNVFESELKDREKKALHWIEVKGLKYRRAAERMGVRLENLKMIVCRARKKLLRAMAELLDAPRSSFSAGVSHADQ